MTTPFKKSPAFSDWQILHELFLSLKNHTFFVLGLKKRINMEKNKTQSDLG